MDKEDRRQTSRMKATKNFSLLSFGEEAEGDEEVTEKVVHLIYLFIHSYILNDTYKTSNNAKLKLKNCNRSQSEILRLLWDIVVFRLVA